MMPENGTITCAFTIRSDTRYLAALRRWVDAMADLAGRGRVGKRARIALEMALIEAVDNAIFHAHRGARDRPIGISMSVSDGRVVMEVVDTGRGIDHANASLPDEMSDRGRGLYLIRNMMTSVASRLNGGRHGLRMTLDL